MNNDNNNNNTGGGGGDASQWRATELLVRGVTGRQAVSRSYKRHRSTWEIWHDSARGQMEEQRKRPALTQQYEGRSGKNATRLEGIYMKRKHECKERSMYRCTDIQTEIQTDRLLTDE